MGPKDTAVSEVFTVSFLDYEKYLPYIYASENNGKVARKIIE